MRKKNLIHDEDEILIEKYGALYEEFALDKGISFLLYYPYFFCRRSFFAFVLYNLQSNPILQVSLNCLHTLFAIIYLWKFMPFKKIRLNRLNIFQETFTLIVFMLTGFFIGNSNPVSVLVLEYTIISCVAFTVIASNLYIFYEFFIGLRKKCKKNVIVAIDKMEDSTVDKSRSNMYKINCNKVDPDRADFDENHGLNLIIRHAHFNSPFNTKSQSYENCFEE